MPTPQPQSTAASQSYEEKKSEPVNPAPSSRGSGTVDDPIIEEVEDIGFSSSINQREQREQQMRMQDQTMGGTGG